MYASRALRALALKLRSSLAAQDYYGLLGLKEAGVMATEDEIKVACAPDLLALALLLFSLADGTIS